MFAASRTSLFFSAIKDHERLERSQASRIRGDHAALFQSWAAEQVIRADRPIAWLSSCFSPVGLSAFRGRRLNSSVMRLCLTRNEE